MGALVLLGILGMLTFSTGCGGASDADIQQAHEDGAKEAKQAEELKEIQHDAVGDKSVITVKDGLVSTAPGVVIRESYGPETGSDARPYTVMLGSDASSELQRAFSEDPCAAVLGKYYGKIPCTPEGDSALLRQLPGEFK